MIDELINIYIVIRSSCKNKPDLESCISRLSISIDAHAISSNPRSSTGSEPQQGSSGNQSRDVIWSGAVNVTEEPVIVVQESEDDVEDRHVLILWKLKAFLSEFEDLEGRHLMFLISFIRSTAH